MNILITPALVWKVAVALASSALFTIAPLLASLSSEAAIVAADEAMATNATAASS